MELFASQGNHNAWVVGLGRRLRSTDTSFGKGATYTDNIGSK